MAQFLRPNSDKANPGAWVRNSDFTTTDIFTMIDEVTPSDSDLIQSPAPPDFDVYDADLTNPGGAPQAGTRTCRYRYQKNSGAGRQIDLVMSVRGPVSTVDTELGTKTHVDIGTGFVQDSFVIGTEPDNWNDVYIRQDADAVGGGGPRSCHVSWEEIEIPDAGAGPVGPPIGGLALMGVGK